MHSAMHKIVLYDDEPPECSEHSSGSDPQPIQEADVARSTLAKSLDPHPLLAEILPPQARLRYAKRQPEFRVFPTGSAEYHWRVVALGSNRTISRHKSLTVALRKCTRLNEQRSEGVRNENTQED